MRASDVIDTAPNSLDNRSPESAGHWSGRQIGSIGTVTRLVLGVGFLAWALIVPHRHPWLDLPGAGSRIWGVLVGLVVLPALLTAVVWLRGRSAAPLRLSNGAACLVTGVLVLAANVAPVAVLTFIGGTMLLLASVGRGGCEVMAVPNLVLGRRDYLACLGVSQIDEWEAGRRHERVVPMERQPDAAAQ